MSSNAVICDSLSLPETPAKQHVVISVAVKRRVEINKINRLVLDEIAKNLQIVAVVERVHVPLLTEM